MQDLFQFLFKYRLFHFKNGDFSFQWSPPTALIATLIPVLLTLLLALYWKGWIRSGSPMAWPFLGLRVAFFLILALLLMRPSLTLSTVVPRENLLALVVDNSQSMTIEEPSGARGNSILPLLNPESEFVKDLDEKFVVKPFLFAAQASSTDLPLQMTWDGEQTNIAAALRSVLSETRNLPLAGVVLITDGADNSYADLAPVMSELKAANVPVYPIGVGTLTIERDAELMQVSSARRILKGSTTTARVSLHQRGFGGSRGRLEVRENNVLVATKEVHFPPDSKTLITEVALLPKTVGIQKYEFTLVPLEGERNERNNSRTTVLEIRDEKPRILYLEGRPRWEYKFIRRAVNGDENLRLETLLRTALNKFYRQGIEEETTLAAGFPKDRETLFEYKGIVLGNVESSFLSYAQMELIKDFVAKRGGGFMMLGGPASFASGAYQSTPIESLLPVLLPEDENSSFFQGLGHLVATAAGSIHPALQISDSTEESSGWESMEPLKDWNLTEGIKPGTTVLARVAIPGSEGAGSNPPLLAFQRFGRGHSIAFMSGSSWRWQMLQDSSDSRHRTFWRQMLRWLVSLSRDQVEVQTERHSYSRNESVKIRAEVRDSSFNNVNDAVVKALVTSPDRGEKEIKLDWRAAEDGVYVGEFQTSEAGQHRVRVQAQRRSGKGEGYGSASASFLVEQGNREFFDASQKRDFLERLAVQTGGRYYSLEEAGRLPGEIVYTEKNASAVEILDLWDMPVNFLFLIGLLIGEWCLRKKHGVI